MNDKIPAKQLMLLTFNTLGTPVFAPSISKRYKKIAEIINASDADIVCLQEVSSYYNYFLLRKLLKNYPYIAYKKYAFGPKGGLATFSKYPLEAVTYKSYSKQGSYRDISIYTQLLKNGMLITKVKDFPLTIINTVVITDFEFNWAPNNKLYNLVRMQVEEAAATVTKIGRENPVIIVGDFNSAKDSPIYTAFLQTTKAVDTFKSHTISTYYNDRVAYRFKGKKSARIDYIFLLDSYDKITIKSVDHLFVEKVAIDKKQKQFLSDHIGLSCKFIFKI